MGMLLNTVGGVLLGKFLYDNYVKKKSQAPAQLGYLSNARGGIARPMSVGYVSTAGGVPTTPYAGLPHRKLGEIDYDPDPGQYKIMRTPDGNVLVANNLGETDYDPDPGQYKLVRGPMGPELVARQVEIRPVR